jgi:hypothetical protein
MKNNWRKFKKIGIDQSIRRTRKKKINLPLFLAFAGFFEGLF